jgi:predicted O-linked N-acetylglucosamine transferase (SPINDLY family)
MSQKIHTLGVKFYEKKEYDAAIGTFQRRQALPEHQFAIGTCFKEKGGYPALLESKKWFEKLLKKSNIISTDLLERTKTNYVASVTQLCEHYINHVEYDQAIALSLDAIALLPESDTFLYNLGYLYKSVGKYDDATNYLRKSLQFNAKHLDTYVELIEMCREQRDMFNQYVYISQGLDNLPNNPALINFLGLYYVASCDPTAISIFNAGLELCGDDLQLKAKILSNLGHVAALEGRITDALQHYDDAIAACPTDMIPYQNKAMDMLYVHNMPYNDVLAYHMRLDAVFKKNKALNVTLQEYHHDKIRIGYVSGDFFGTHPMTFFIHSLLNKYDHDKFDVFCYSIFGIADTSKYSSNIHWKNIKYLSTQGCADIITSDQIDVLIDLSGHTSGNRLDIFATRLAKLQLSYLGYPCITGLSDIDYFIIDHTFDFQGCKTAAMDGCYTHFNPPFVPQELIQPYHANKYITFGSLNKVAKINDATIQLWDRLLDEHPTAKMIVKYGSNIKFKNQDRIIFLSQTESYNDYIKQYDQIDISLDTFPYSGTTTTCESLLAGTPVITLADRQNKTIHQNTTSSILINSDLNQFIANDTDTFIQIVSQTIDQLSNTPTFKQDIQCKFLNGLVTNGAQYMVNYEKLILDAFTKGLHC